MSAPTEKGSLAQSLVNFQAATQPIPRKKTVTVQTRTGGRYTFDYAPHEVILEAIKDDLAANDLAVVQPLTSDSEGRLFVQTIVVHASGETLESLTPVNTANLSNQEIGSAVTYMRRYALSAMLGLATDDDDDANLADGNNATEVQKRGKGSSGSDSPPAPSAGSPDDEPINALTYAECSEFARQCGFSWESAVKDYDETYDPETLTVGQAKAVCDWLSSLKTVPA